MSILPKPVIDKLPPHNIEAEAALLGCIILSPVECMAECAPIIKTEWFYDLRHRCLWKTFLSFHQENVGFDTILLYNRLKENKHLQEAGDYYFASLPDMTPSAANIDYYIDIVREKYILRSIVSICTDATLRAYEIPYGDDPTELASQVEKNLRGVYEADGTKNLTTRELVQHSISKIEEYHQSQGKPTGLETGLKDLDNLTMGLQKGDMIVIAARPSCGKTSLAMQIAEHVAVTNKIPVGVFSLEMTGESLTTRMVCSRARVNMWAIRKGYLAERDFPKLTQAAADIAGAPLYIDDACGITSMELRTKARRMSSLHGIKLVVIDYMQLLRCAKKCDNRNQEVTHISSDIKTMAKELGVPVIVLCQLNRDSEKTDRKPRMSDLRESGAIEQDADLIGLLYRDGTDDDERPSPYLTPTNLLIAKQRNGPVGDISLLFNKSLTRFESMSNQTPEE